MEIKLFLQPKMMHNHFSNLTLHNTYYILRMSFSRNLVNVKHSKLLSKVVTINRYLPRYYIFIPIRDRRVLTIYTGLG